VIAQILATLTTVAAISVRPTKPGNTDPRTDWEVLHAAPRGHGASHNLVAGDKRQLGFCQVSIHNVYVGPAQSASVNLDQNLAWTRLWSEHFLTPKRLALLVQNHCLHASTMVRGES
jgi:hypothetical protein